MDARTGEGGAGARGRARRARRSPHQQGARDGRARPEVFNGYCGAESGYVPVSTVAPAALVGELELQRVARASERSPILPAPWAEPPAAARGAGSRAAPEGRRSRREHSPPAVPPLDGVLLVPRRAALDAFVAAGWRIFGGATPLLDAERRRLLNLDLTDPEVALERDGELAAVAHVETDLEGIVTHVEVVGAAAGGSGPRRHRPRGREPRCAAGGRRSGRARVDLGAGVGRHAHRERGARPALDLRGAGLRRPALGGGDGGAAGVAERVSLASGAAGRCRVL